MFSAPDAAGDSSARQREGQWGAGKVSGSSWGTRRDTVGTIINLPELSR